jgi:hypothetical protein
MGQPISRLFQWKNQLAIIRSPHFIKCDFLKKIQFQLVYLEDFVTDHPVGGARATSRMLRKI